jgi:hypothetical protein
MNDFVAFYNENFKRTAYYEMHRLNKLDIFLKTAYANEATGEKKD